MGTLPVYRMNVGLGKVVASDASRQLNAGECSELYASSASKIDSRMSHAWVDETLKRRNAAFSEFVEFLGILSPQYNKTFLNCTPTDILVYIENHWVNKHGGTVLPGGETVASPSGVNGFLSHLSTCFEMLHRTGPYNYGG